MRIEEGLDFIEGHFEPPTYKTGGKQIPVNNREEALTKFKECNILDCGISAYLYPVPEYKGINRQTSNFFLSDLDKKNFKTKKSFEDDVQNTLQNLKDKLHGANPSVLWSGGGNHFLQPLYADIVFEMESVFTEFIEPSGKLMQYAEKLVTDNKGDPCHCNTVSFNNCTIRIPGSNNSKYIQFNEKGKVVDLPPQSKVRIVQRWDGHRPNIRWLFKGIQCI